MQPKRISNLNPTDTLKNVLWKGVPSTSRSCAWENSCWALEQIQISLFLNIVFELGCEIGGPHLVVTCTNMGEQGENEAYINPTELSQATRIEIPHQEPKLNH